MESDLRRRRWVLASALRMEAEKTCGLVNFLGTTPVE
jgi:hypothetical protein